MTEYFSIVIPTMWKSSLTVELLNKFIACDKVKEIIVINNDLWKTPTLPDSDKIIHCMMGVNIYVNPAWNLGASIANHNLILSNDDIMIENVDEVLTAILKSDLEIIGADKRPDDKGKRIKEIKHFPMNGFGTFMYVKNYVNIPDIFKIWIGDRILFETSESRGVLKNFGFSGKNGITLNSEGGKLRRTIALNDKKTRDALRKYKLVRQLTTNLQR